jgi:hypothetical protein
MYFIALYTVPTGRSVKAERSLLKFQINTCVKTLGISITDQHNLPELIINSLKPKLVQIAYTNLVRTSKRTQHFTITKIN